MSENFKELYLLGKMLFNGVSNLEDAVRHIMWKFRKQEGKVGGIIVLPFDEGNEEVFNLVEELIDRQDREQGEEKID